MSQVITAVFGNPSAASAAVQDIEVANIPSARIVRDTASNENWRHNPSRQCAMVTVAVDEPHAALVSGIFRMYAPVTLQKDAA